MGFLERPLQKALFTGLLLTSIALSDGCGTTATPTPTSTPTPTPRPTVAVPLQRPTQPTPIPTLTPTRTVPISAPTPVPTPVPVATPRPTATFTPVPPTLTVAPTPKPTRRGYDELLNFVSRNYFRDASFSISVSYGDVLELSNLRIPFSEAYTVEATVSGPDYSFFIVNKTLVKEFPNFEKQLINSGWSGYRGGYLKRTDTWRDTWVTFEDDRIVTISGHPNFQDIKRGADAYLSSNPGGLTLAPFRREAERMKGLIPEKFMNSVKSINLDGDDVEITFQDFEIKADDLSVYISALPVRNSMKSWFSYQLSFWKDSSSFVREYESQKVNGYTLTTLLFKYEGKFYTRSLLGCSPDIFCMLRNEWGERRPDMSDIERRFGEYLTSVYTFFVSR